jgi:hypothetical protein
LHTFVPPSVKVLNCKELIIIKQIFHYVNGLN